MREAPVPTISPETQMARYAAFEAQAAPLERHALARYAEGLARLAEGDAIGALAHLEAAVADLRAVDALQRTLLPDLEGGSRELAAVESLLRRVRERIAAGGDTGTWEEFSAPGGRGSGGADGEEDPGGAPFSP